MSRTTSPVSGSPQDRLREIQYAAEEDSLELLADAIADLIKAVDARDFDDVVESGWELAQMALVASSPRFRDVPE